MYKQVIILLSYNTFPTVFMELTPDESSRFLVHYIWIIITQFYEQNKCKQGVQLGDYNVYNQT